ARRPSAPGRARRGDAHPQAHRLRVRETTGIRRAREARDRQLRPAPPQAVDDPGGPKDDDARARLALRCLRQGNGPPQRGAAGRIQPPPREAPTVISGPTPRSRAVEMHELVLDVERDDEMAQDLAADEPGLDQRRVTLTWLVHRDGDMRQLEGPD